MSSQSSRPIYLRDQAEKCQWHASKIGNAETQAVLLKLAAEYIQRAADIDRARDQARAKGPLPQPATIGHVSALPKADLPLA